ncbi:tape measure protein [Actinotignum urinale]|uniref:tape measure protein n=1 Tax=Actinotignum urinale TaxID=190146 RepID=UPI002543A959|nr:tape measure protein [Actinotignum urinale]WIK58863.1 tape measure protein [Actinotignum urinale]
MAELAAAYVQIIPSLKGLAEKLREELGGPATDKPVTESGNKIRAGFTNAFRAAGQAGMAAIGGVSAAITGIAVKGGISRALKIENAEAKLRGLGHSTASIASVMESANKAVKGTAFGLDAAASSAAMLSAAGVQSGKDLTDALTSIADVAQISGRSMEDVGLIFGFIAARGKLQGDDMLQLMSAGVPVLQLLGKQLGKTSGEVSAMVSKGQIDFATFQKAMEAGLGGAAQEAGSTFTGALANVKAALSRLGQKAASPALEGLRRVFVQLAPAIDTVAQALTPFITKLGEGFVAVADKAAAGLQKFTAFMQSLDGSPLQGIVGMLPVLALGVAQVVGAFSGFGLLKSLLGGLGAGMGQATGKATLFSRAFGVLKGVLFKSPWGLLIGGVAGLGAAMASSSGQSGALAGIFSKVTAGISNFAASIPTIVAKINSVIVAVVSKIVAALPQILESFKNIFTQLASIITTTLPAILGSIIPSLGQLVSALAQAFITILPVLIKAFFSLFSALVDALGKILPGLISGITQLISGLVKFLPKLIPVLVGGAVALFMALVNALSKILPPLIQGFIQLINALVRFLPVIIPALIQGAITLFMALVQALPLIIPPLIEAIPVVIAALVTGLIQAVPVLLQAGLQLFGALVTALMQLIPQLLGKLGELGLRLCEKMGEIWESLKGIVSTAIGAVVGFVASLPGRAVGALASFGTKIGQVASGAWGSFRTAVSDGITGAINLVKELPAKALSALGSLGDVLVDSGKALINGFKKGIESAVSGVVNAVKGALSWVRNLFPFSPAKEGPFSGKGWVLYSGLSVGEAMAEGIKKSTPLALAAGKALTREAQASMASLNAPSINAGKGMVGSRPIYKDSGHAPADRVVNVYVENPFTGEYLLAKAREIAGKAINADAGKTVLFRGGM